MQLGGDYSQVINDNDRHPHVDRQMGQQSRIGVKATRGTTHANNWKIMGDHLGVRYHHAAPSPLKL